MIDVLSLDYLLLTFKAMSYEAGSKECRRIVEAKENLIKTMQTLKGLNNTEDINAKIKSIYDELENMHEARKKIEHEE